MTTTGEQQPDPQPTGPNRGRLPRTLAILSLLATAAAGGTWAEVHYAGRIHLDRHISADGVSQDAAGVQNALVGGAGQTQVDEILPVRVTFPATVTSPDGYAGSRYAVDTRAADCGTVFAAQAPAAVTEGCAGYLTADYVRQDDHAVYSSVTVLYYPDVATATRVAKALKAPSAALADLLFRQPGSSLPAAAESSGAASAGTAPATATATATASATAGPTATATATATGRPVSQDPANAATKVQVASVGRAVTIVQSAFADGRAVNAELDTPTWYLSYTVASALAWEPDQPASASSPTP